MKFDKQKVMKVLPFIMLGYFFNKLSQAFTSANGTALGDKIMNGISGIGSVFHNPLPSFNYQYVIAVHNDKDHLHCHVIFNNTNLYNGLSFTTEHNQGRKSERAWAELREISDEICAEHGISVIEPIGKGVSHYENEMKKEGKSWKEKLRVRIAEVIRSFRSVANNFNQIAVRVNSTGKIYQEDLDALKKGIEDLRQLLRYFRSVLQNTKPLPTSQTLKKPKTDD